MAKEKTPEAVPAKDVIVNALLASMQNAITDAKKTPEIITTFWNFYDELAISAAFEVLGLKRSARRRDRKIDLEELLTHLRKEDWKAKNVNFAAVDFKEICLVPSGIGDELNLRYELIELRTKFSDMTAALEEVKQLGKTVKDANDTFLKVVTNSENVGKPSYSKSLKNWKQVVPRPPTPPPSQVHAMKNPDPAIMEQDSVTQNHNEKSGDDGFTVVTKRKRKSGAVIVGAGSSSDIKTVPKTPRIKTGMILVSRCDPETTCEDISREIQKLQTETPYKLHGVEIWKSRYQTYSSFKVTYELGVKPLQQFLNELLYNENVDQLWPAGVLVKSFRPNFVKKPFYKTK